MNIAALEFTPAEEALLDRALYVYRQKNMADRTPEEAITEALSAYLALFEPRYGQPDELSWAVVYGPRHGRASVIERSAETSASSVEPRSRRSLDDVARLLVNGHRPPAPAPVAHLDEVARRLVHGAGETRGPEHKGAREQGDDLPIAESPPLHGLDLTDEERELLRRATLVYQRKRGARCSACEAIVASLDVYLRLYELAYGPQDPLSRIVVHGPLSAPTPVTDLDEVARLIVRMGRCARCGNCCRRTIGVRVSAEEIERIEALGYRREHFLDRDGMIKAGPGGCYFLMDGGPGKARCRIYSHRPQICRDFFCELAMRNSRGG